MYIHGSPQHRAHAHNPMCGVINSQCRSKELHIFVIIYVIILVFDGFTPPHFWTFWINFCFCKTVLLSLRDWGVIDRDGQWFGKGECNRLRSWTFLLHVIGPQLPKQRRFHHFQLPSIFPPRVHAVIMRWSRSPLQCVTNQQKGVTCTFPPNQSANRVMFSANQYLTCKAVFMRPHPKFHRSN